jgi:hypothetical protein
MNSINITLNLSTEDRARIDRLTEALENVIQLPKAEVLLDTEQIDDVQQRLAETVAKTSDPVEAPKTTTEEVKEETLPAASINEEEPTAEEESTTEEAKPTVTLEQIQQKVVQLAASNGGAKKAKVREIINAHSKKVSDLPEAVWTEVWEKLTELESED